MKRQVLVDEEIIVGMMAQVALDQYMVELLTTCMVRTFKAEDRGKWLDDVEKALTSRPLVEAASTDAQAVLFSDAAVQIGERGRAFIKRLRTRARANTAGDAAV